MTTTDIAAGLIALAFGSGFGAAALIWRCCPLRVFGTGATGTIERFVRREVMVQAVRGAVPRPVQVREAVIAFTTRAGETVRIQASVHGTGAKAPGDSVPIRYRVARPNEAEIETPSRPFRAALFLVVLSIALLLAAAVFAS
ncbi:MAG: hypothetical protein JNL73_15005 [Anaerolineales bacterium]|nr:hypothetical protein [Anaerolineales bacterium]